MRDFLIGVSYVSRGFRSLWSPGLRRFVVLPVLVNALVFVALFWLGYAGIQSLLAGMLPAPSALTSHGWWGEALAGLLAFFYWILLPLYLLAAAVITFFTFTAAANLIASPFNGMLAARVEQRVTGRLPSGIEGGALLVEVTGAIGDELRKLVYFALLAIPVFVLTLIPVVNLLAPLLWGVYGAWVVALEYMDYPLGNQGLTFGEQRVEIRRRRWLHLGFGAGMLAMTIIPGVNLLAMPTGVIGATLLRSALSAPGNRDRSL